MNSLPFVFLRSLWSQVITLTLSVYLFQMILFWEDELTRLCFYIFKGPEVHCVQLLHDFHIFNSYQCATHRGFAVDLLSLVFGLLPLLLALLNIIFPQLLLLQESAEATSGKSGLWLVCLVALIIWYCRCLLTNQSFSIDCTPLRPGLYPLLRPVVVAGT